MCHVVPNVRLFGKRDCVKWFQKMNLYIFSKETLVYYFSSKHLLNTIANQEYKSVFVLLAQREGLLPKMWLPLGASRRSSLEASERSPAWGSSCFVLLEFKDTFKPFHPLEWRGSGAVSQAVPCRTPEGTCSGEWLHERETNIYRFFSFPKGRLIFRNTESLEANKIECKKRDYFIVATMK